MVILLTMVVVLLIIIVANSSVNKQYKEIQQLSDASKTMSIEELLSQNDLLEKEWSVWNEKWAKKVAWKRNSSAEYNMREKVALKIN